MKSLPNVWGRGALFAYSGLEGTTTYHNSMCGQLMAEHIGMTFDDGAAELYLRLTGAPWLQEIDFSIVASDLIEGTLNDGAEFKFVFLNQDTVIGYAPKNFCVPIFHADLGKEKAFDNGKGYECEKAWYAFTSEEDGEIVCFAVSRGKSYEETVAKAKDALQADVCAIADKHRAYYDIVPELCHATDEEQSTFAKCFSVMKSQVYTEEGVFKGRWTTPDRTPHKKWWLWDSVFHSIGNVYIEPELAYDTLRSILDTQEPDGFIPHMSFPEGWIVPHTQPPLIAWGTYRLYERTQRKDWVIPLYEGNKKFLNWIMKNRDSNKNYLYEWYVDPDTEVCRCGESGMDNTPRFDVVQLMDAIDFSCYMANEMRHMEKLARILELSDDVKEYHTLFKRISEQINTVLYDEKDGRYYDRELESGQFRKVSTPSGLLPLFAGVCPPDRAKCLAEDICNPNTFNTPLPIPTVSLDDPYHSKDYWRGTVWINYNYMVQQGLRENGFVEEANYVADATMAAIAHWYVREGCIFEVYDPQNILCPSELERKGKTIKPAEYFSLTTVAEEDGNKVAAFSKSFNQGFMAATSEQIAVTGGQLYSLSFDYRLASLTNKSGVDESVCRYYGIRLYVEELDANGNITAEVSRGGTYYGGGIADRRTIPGMMLCDNAELVAVMEINMELAEKARAKWGCKKAYDNEMDLLADPEIDAVYIASPVVCHARQAMAAADAGKHILIEKPLALTTDEGEQVVRYCEGKGVKIAVGLMMRFGTHVQEMKKTIAENKIGRVVSGYAQFTCWYPDMPGNWRQSKKNGGGGCLMDMGVHCIDLMQYITGTKVKEVMALHDTLSFQYEVEDTSTVLMRMENGSHFVVQSNFNIPDAAAKWRLEFFGEQGRLLGDNVIGQIDGGILDAIFLDKQGDYNARQDTNKSSVQSMEVEFGNMYAREIASFSDSLLHGTPVEVPAAEAVYVQRVMEAAYASGEEGCLKTL